jgi:putative colanic acid biosynthesis acetyltransferase WcaF
METPKQDLSHFRSEWSVAHRAARALWGVVWALLFRPTPRPLHAWRRLLLRAFGARIGKGARVYASAKIWAPWNLSMGEHSVLGDAVDCYAVDRIEIGAHAVVSQYAHLCAATHDIDRPDFPLVTRPIRIGAGAWIAAGAFVGPGVTIGDGAVVGARAVVVRDVAPRAVVAGNPARVLRSR